MNKIKENNVIIFQVRLFSEQYTYVITSGGIGPTHDDKTFEGVAKAFNVELKKNVEIENICINYFNNTQNTELKLAHIPESAKLVYGYDKVNQKNLVFPLVTLQNVYMFPGIPQLMESSFKALEDLFRNPTDHRTVGEVYVNQNEFSITDIINQAFKLFGDSVEIGSYPAMYNNYYKVCLALESSQKVEFDKCKQFFLENLNQHISLNYDKEPLTKVDFKVYDFCDQLPADDTFKSRLRHSLNVLEECIDRYAISTFCVGFNGGKDCTALLHLVAAVMNRKLGGADKMDCLYLRRGQPFPEVEQFMKQTTTRYNINMITSFGGLKDALTDFKNTHPAFQSVIMGTRTTDPFSSHLEDFHATDKDWPQLMRISPVLSWSYEDIWRFIRHFNLPYCSLYDVGYTSLGSMENTHPNPSLQVTDSKGNCSYKPAFLLTDYNLERAGRN